MPSRTIIAALAGSIAVLSTSALANDDENRLYNPGFEEQHPVFPDLPLGWQDFNMEANDYVDIGDPDAQVRSGNRSIRLTPAAGAADRFKGITTNVFRPDGSDLFDPDYEYLGGDITISGYYLVPEGETLSDTVVGVKLEFRREPPWGAETPTVELRELDLKQLRALGYAIE